MKLWLLAITAAVAYIWRTMPTQQQLETAIDNLEAALTAEIDQIKMELQKVPEVPQSAIDRLTALSERVSGIIADATEPTA